jgi:hypothetical protein
MANLLVFPKAFTTDRPIIRDDEHDHAENSPRARERPADHA